MPLPPLYRGCLFFPASLLRTRPPPWSLFPHFASRNAHNSQVRGPVLHLLEKKLPCPPIRNETSELRFLPRAGRACSRKGAFWGEPFALRSVSAPFLSEGISVSLGFLLDISWVQGLGRSIGGATWLKPAWNRRTLEGEWRRACWTVCRTR